MDPLAAVRAAGVCGPPGRSLAEVAGAALRGASEPPAWPQIPPGRTLLTHRGRDAIAASCALLGIGRGDEVLMPSWNCGTEVDAVLASGADVVLYRVDLRGAVDAEDLGNRITDRTRAVHVTHYFGWPQDVARVRAVAHAAGLLVVEDCALALFSADGAEWLGRDADAAVFSFPKSLPVPDGGALVLRAGLPERVPVLPPPPRGRVLRRTLGLVKRRLAARRSRRLAPGRAAIGDTPAVGTRTRPDMPPDYYWGGAVARGISRVTLGLLGGVDAQDVAERRRRNYVRLLERAAGVAGVRPLLGAPPPGVCPLELPLRVERRDAWVAALRRRGVPAIAWWSGYHRALPWDDFPEACSLKDHVVAVPVHQDLDDAAVERIAAALEEVARETAA